MKTAKAFLVAAFITATCGCAAPNVVALVPEVNRGPAADVKPKKILALTSTCGAMDARCTQAYRAAVDNIIRGDLEFELNAGDGTLVAKTDHATGKSPISITALDLNGDGAVDLATANRTATR